MQQFATIKWRESYYEATAFGLSGPGATAQLALSSLEFVIASTYTGSTVTVCRRTGLVTIGD